MRGLRAIKRYQYLLKTHYLLPVLEYLSLNFFVLVKVLVVSLVELVWKLRRSLSMMVKRIVLEIFILLKKQLLLLLYEI